MKTMSAYEAKARFGQLLDAARNEPVTIEKHGRGVAVVIAKEEYDAIQEMRLQLLKSELQQGLEDLSSGRFESLKPGDLAAFSTSIKNSGRQQKKG